MEKFLFELVERGGTIKKSLLENTMNFFLAILYLALCENGRTIGKHFSTLTHTFIDIFIFLNDCKMLQSKTSFLIYYSR